MSENPFNVNGPGPTDFFNWVNQFAQPMLEAGSKMSGQFATPQAAADPWSAWRKAYETNEQAMTQFMAQLITTPEFAAGLGRTAGNQAAMREAIKRTAQSYLEAANMPTREDLTRIAALVVGLDAKLDDLCDRLEDNLDQTAESTNNIAASFERLDKLDSVLERLSAIEQKLAALETKLEREPETPPKSITEKPKIRLLTNPKPEPKTPATPARPRKGIRSIGKATNQDEEDK